MVKIQFELDSFYTANDLITKLLEGDGAGSGLDADLLDGHHGAYYLPLSSYTAADILAKLLTVHGPGSGLNADLLDGTELSKILAIGATIPASTNLNSYNATGLYHQPSTANASSGSNYPVALAGMLEVISDGPLIYQKYTAYDSAHNVYVRTCENGSWYSWSRILDTADLTTLNNNLALKLNAATYTAADILSKLLGVDGAGSGLDADTLDGVQYSTINSAIAAKLSASSYTAADIIAKLLTVDGTGTGLDADKLDGQEGAYYLPAGSYTAADILAKLLTVDGAGSGLDADKLDGAQPSATGGTASAIVQARAGGTISPDYLPGFADEDGTFRIPKRVEKKTISSGSPVTTSTFSNLDGNSAEDYILKYRLYKNGTGDVSFLLRFNADSDYHYSSRVKTFIDNSGSLIEDPASLSQQILRIGQTKWSAVNWLKGKLEIAAKSGAPRFVEGRAQFYANLGQSGNDIFSGFWDNTADNITSMTILNTGGNSFYGTIELLKLVDLVIS
nr:pyocin knob domain-containing protein [uncultured Methanobacterium sp.]